MSPLQSSNRARLIIAAATCLVFSGFVLTYTNESDILRYVPTQESIYAAFGQSGGKQYPGSGPWDENDLCGESDYLDGSWQPIIGEERITSLQGILEANAYGEIELECYGVGISVHDITPDNTDLVDERRIQIANYAWTPRRKCAMAKLDVDPLIKRLLRSPSGLTLVGDSLMGTTFEDFLFKFRRLQGTDYPFALDMRTPRTAYISLKPDHPVTERYLSAAGVTVDRLEYPLITFYRDHHLLEYDDLVDCFADLVGTRGWQPPKPDFVSFEKNVTWWNEWVVDRNRKVELVPDRSGWTPKLEKSVIVVATGAHWVPWEFGEGLYSDEIKEPFYKMERLIHSRFQALEHPERSLAFYRSQSPGHLDCDRYNLPDNMRTDVVSPWRPELDSYNWFDFAQMDNVMKNITGYEAHSYISRLSHSDSTLRFFNAWPLTVTRPDAHMAPPQDCLHQCAYTGPAQTNKYLWHLMMMDAVNDDYL